MPDMRGKTKRAGRLSRSEARCHDRSQSEASIVHWKYSIVLHRHCQRGGGGQREGKKNNVAIGFSRRFGVFEPYCAITFLVLFGTASRIINIYICTTIAYYYKYISQDLRIREFKNTLKKLCASISYEIYEIEFDVKIKLEFLGIGTRKAKMLDLQTQLAKTKGRICGFANKKSVGVTAEVQSEPNYHFT